LTLEITAEAGVYAIESAAGLSQARLWRCSAIVPVSSSNAYWRDSLLPKGCRFYRLRALTNLAWIPPGTFVMGSPPEEALRGPDETQHTVALTRGVFMGKWEVTQAEYQGTVGHNPSFFRGHPRLPVEQVSWEDATSFCALLTRQQQDAGSLPPGWVYRLPTEAEWEYACRAGTVTAFHYGNVLRGGMANFNGMEEYNAEIGGIYVPPTPATFPQRTLPVGSYIPNAFGLCDMHGNVWEWCQDWYAPYPSTAVTDPQGPPNGTHHVFRGGDYWDFASWCRSAFRLYEVIDAHASSFGFRVVLAPNQPQVDSVPASTD